MPTAPPFRFRLAASVAVTVSSGLVATFFGLLAVLGYGFGDGPISHPQPFVPLTQVGLIAGAISGLGVGGLWSRWMSKRARAYLAAGKVRAWAVLAGATLGGGVAGTLSTLILHASLQLARQRLQPDFFLEGLVFGIPAGLLVGLLGGTIWLLAMRRAARVAATP